MASEEILRKTIHNADGKPFAKYRNIEGSFVTEGFELFVDEVQGDRTGHTRMRVRVPMKRAGFPEDLRSNESRVSALRDIIARRFWESARTHARSPIPKTDGGEVYMPRPGQEVLSRGSVVVTEHYVEARFTADLPSKANKVDEMATIDLIFGRISLIVSESMLMSAYKRQKLYSHVETAENADWIRSRLPEMGLAAFVAVGSVLPRREDDLAPMIDAVPFDCDDCLKVTMEVPNGEPIVGMGIPCGYTAVTGAVGSGKSTLADAIFAGVYNHIPGDGREYVVSDPDAVYVMAEAGRPEGEARLSGPASELASVNEAIEAGSHLIIVDEEYSSPCVIRRAFMSPDESGYTLSEIGHSLGESGVSILAVTGDESAVRMADTVLLVDGFRVKKLDVDRLEGGRDAPAVVERYPVAKNVSFEKSRKEVSTAAPAIRTVEIGEYKVQVPVAGFFDQSQTREVADAIAVARDMMDGSLPLREVCQKAIEKVESDDVSEGTGMGHARARAVDMAAVLSRHPQMLFIRRD
ncbi:MAG: ABC-ATPase domain-containing protein [Thermoplasmata archaeon]|nr:ABC-ATPase domain-containing protein [Thermoplasmata archaeon]